MKALPSIAFSEFTGSAGEVTARSIGGRTLLNHKAYQAKTKTPAQAVSRNTLSKVSRVYKQLTDSQMKAWEALAEHLRGNSAFGKASEMTGHNAFVRINANREMAGEGLLFDAPDYHNNMPAVSYEEIWITDKRVILQGITNPTGTYKLVVKMSAGQKRGVSKGWNSIVVITPGMLDDWGEAGLTKLYNAKIGFMPAIGEKVFIELHWLNPANGFVGESLRVVRFCISDEEAHEQGFKERIRVTEENIKESRGIESFRYELTEGPSFVSSDADCRATGGSASSSVELKDVPDGFISGNAYLVGRGVDGEKYMPQTVYVQVVKDGSDVRIDYNHRGGKYRFGGVYFGTGLLI